ncbi:ABC transporter permease [Jiangella mangrovi]|uniref:NitT/TauT family transport system permease protein n=1 Tax=Jiangella mangrovi TaxID=1524084 RepID=A0A7W9GWJ5_9ACTN|nr:ABC transporter permease [Jiangella mangrovi]MBB5791078.1 NitT/TauT family transport system permease protein [Jiangella mangrovi]
MSTVVVTEHRPAPADAAGQPAAVAAPESPPRRRRGLALRALLHVGFVGAVLTAWELSSGRWIDPLLLSKPSEVLRQLWDWIVTGHLAFHLQFTLTALVIGFLLGAVVAFGLAVLFAELPRAGRFAEIYIIVFNGIPTIALIPVFIVWFGFGIETKIFMGFLTVFFIVFIASFQALRNTDSRYLELARVLEANTWQRLVKFRLWAAVPFLASAFKLALPATALAVVTAEFLGSNRGIGFLLIRASNLLDMASLFAAVLVVTALVQILTLAAAALESRLLTWVPKEKK